MTTDTDPSDLRVEPLTSDRSAQYITGPICLPADVLSKIVRLPGRIRILIYA